MAEARQALVALMAASQQSSFRRRVSRAWLTPLPWNCRCRVRSMAVLDSDVPLGTQSPSKLTIPS
eukprot:12910314-Prorocentrum_lima.AAC.1